MTSTKDLIHHTLKTEPNFRERARKDNGFIILLKRRYPQLKDFPNHLLVDFARDFLTMDREWRLLLKNDTSLRGKDYSDGAVLADEKKISLGYESNHFEDMKTINNYKD